MSKLFRSIRDAVLDDRLLVSEHAYERCEERNVTLWQLSAGIADARIVRDHPKNKPNPTVVVRQVLMDGGEVEVVWAWLAKGKRAMLVTVYFPD